MLNEAKVQKMIQAKQVKKQKGASMIEYALVVAGVAGVATLLFAADGTVVTGITGLVEGTFLNLGSG